MSDMLGKMNYGTSLLGQEPKPMSKPTAPKGLGTQGKETVRTSIASGNNTVIKTLKVDPEMGPDTLVIQVQDRLGFDNSDGMVTEDLIDRVKNFQTEKGLQVTGNLDSATLDAMGIDATELDAEEVVDDEMIETPGVI